MSTEPQPKRESYLGWFIGVGVLLLLAAAVPVALKLYGPREQVMDLHGDPGGQIVWQCQTDGRVHSGVTNLPVRLAFRARFMVFTAHRTNYTGPLALNVGVAGAFFKGPAITRSTGGVRFQHGIDSWIIYEVP